MKKVIFPGFAPPVVLPGENFFYSLCLMTIPKLVTLIGIIIIKLFESDRNIITSLFWLTG